MFASFPNLIEKVSLRVWIEQRNVLQARAFVRTKPMHGAVSLVQYLVTSTLPSSPKRRNTDVVKHRAGIPIAIATGSNRANFEWKTVSMTDHLLSDSSHTYQSFSVSSDQNVS